MVDDNKPIDNEFEAVPSCSVSLCPLAMNRANRLKNRYRNIVPVESTRVRLRNLERFGLDSDYINANFLENGRYICTQAPVPASIDSFWVMIWQQKVPLILMLGNLIENGKLKCHRYWPAKATDENFYANHQIAVRVDHVQELFQYQIRITNLTITSENQSRKLLHVWYYGWSDFGCPKSYQDMEFLRAIVSSSINTPFVIHCSAGVGRTGTYALIEYCLYHKTRDVAQALATLRQQRAGLVQHPEQYKFAKTYIEKHLSEDSFLSSERRFF